MLASLVAQMVKICLWCKRHRFDPWVRKIPWRKKWQPTPVLLPGESHGQRSLAVYRPWNHKESDTTEQLTLLSLFTWCCTFYKFGHMSCICLYSTIQSIFTAGNILCARFIHPFLPNPWQPATTILFTVSIIFPFLDVSFGNIIAQAVALLLFSFPWYWLSQSRRLTDGGSLVPSYCCKVISIIIWQKHWPKLVFPCQKKKILYFLYVFGTYGERWK